ncbi:bifunctional folylpolyglutamate synthase/dihydrofolate synthase [Vagococcus humatus]|uniref:Dihydrofolate synthase/folylpolyglutamate synthase n=1 Tax=Vagococcus humatus TaxID=1889241 RepID=A0A429Z786_9ENTE|nr:folylpolyglutamate synthase/dihydrofolate synthase family protein [Vagococcus humatus]RST89543.1 bifunctional folylpolyglutamate synthase/dihydrofolate synthase [Vagococcus humatus]
MELQEALEWIHSRLPLGSRPGLIRINALLDAVDNPQKKIKTVHIGGTNGKGSTVTFLRCLLEEKGYTVGTFTSPFIEVFNERISINGEPIPNEDLVQLVELFQPIVEKLDQDEELKGATEFEIITAMMFHYFYEKQVDLAIVEVGLGGTYDCTNVITPLVTGIVTIGLDHMDILGDTIEKIAAQKAGIIKPNRPVVVGKLSKEALGVIESKAVETDSPIYRYNQEYQVSYKGFDDSSIEEVFTFKNDTVEWSDLRIPLTGRHQVDNASVALQLYLALADELGYTFSKDSVQASFKQARWAGRMEWMQKNPPIIVDGAHNEPAVQVLVDNLTKEYHPKRLFTIFSAINTKDISHMLHLLETVPNQHLYVTTFEYPKALSFKEYQQFGITEDNFLPDWKKGIDQIKAEMTEDDLLIITGSLYFISQVRHYF